MVSPPNHRAACSLHFPRAAISPPLRRAIGQSRSGWETCVVHLSAFSLSCSRRRFLLRGRVRLPAPPPLAAEAIHPSLGQLPASRLRRGSLWGSCAFPTDAEITADLENSRQRKSLGGLRSFWGLLCPAEEAAARCGQAGLPGQGPQQTALALLRGQAAFTLRLPQPVLMAKETQSCAMTNAPSQ